MLNFAEQTGSGAVTVVWSFLMGGVRVTFRTCGDAEGPYISLWKKEEYGDGQTEIALRVPPT